MFFLRTVRLSLTWLEIFTQKQHVSFKMVQVPPCSGIRRSISCLFWSTTPAKLCWLFIAILRKFIPRNLILGVMIRMARICSPEQASVISHSCFAPQFLPSTEFCVVLFAPTTGQVLLSTLSWCSACTSVSEGVLVIYMWREMYSTSTSPPPCCSLLSQDILSNIFKRYFQAKETCLCFQFIDYS